MTALPLMLFAAGLGTRMGALTRDRPKPLVEVAGRPLIGHALALAEAAGIATTVANVHYRADQMRDWLTPRGITVSHETPEILDTGGGLKAALPLLGHPSATLTLNTDAIWTGQNPLAALIDAWDPFRMDALLALVPVARATGRHPPGDFARGAHGHLSRGGDLVYTGAQIVATAPVARVPGNRFSLNLVWDDLAVRGRLFGLTHDGGWCDVGTPEGVALAESMLADV